MHLFLYQAARHSTSRWGNRHRYKQNTKRGDFNLDLLRRGIKGRYEIICHGDHPFQKVLEQVDLIEEFYGHIVAIEEAKNAIWFKLNYDQVGKSITKYIGGWRDLDPAAIEAYATEYKVLKARHGHLTGLASSLRYQCSRTNDFMKSAKNVADPLLDEALANAMEHAEVLDATWKKVNKDIERTKAKMTKVQDKIKAYMKDQKF